MKTIVLYSGGLDSTVVLAQALREHGGNDVLALTIDYNQSNRQEIEVCRRLAGYWGFRHKIINVHLERTDAREEIPARNTVFLAKALEWCLLEDAEQVLYGAEPDATYTDSSPAYIEAMNEVFKCHGRELKAPIRNWGGKLNVLTAALRLGIPLDLVHSSRTNAVNGACKASTRFLTTLHKLFPAINPIELVEIVAWTFRFQTNPYNISCTETDSFKLLPAVFLQASMAEKETRDILIYTTGNWGRSMEYVNGFLKRFRSLSIQVIPKDKEGLVDLLAKNGQYNTNNEVAQWGIKQALSRLPRPGCGAPAIFCPITQGHLSFALTDLGYEVAEEGIPIITEAGQGAITLPCKRVIDISPRS